MAQGDMNIANQGFPSFRADLNDQLEALVTNSSGATAPSTTFPHQWWLDTSTTPNTLRQRNEANDAWIAVGQFDQASNEFILTADDAVISGDLTVGTDALVTSGGNVGIGTDTPGALLDVDGDALVAGALGVRNAPINFVPGFQPRIQVADTFIANVGAARFNAVGTSAPGFALLKTRGTAVNDFTAVQNNDVLGNFDFFGGDGTFSAVAARFSGGVDGTVSTGVVPGRLTFFTATSGGALTERMRIGSSGNVMMGTTTPLDIAAGTTPGFSFNPGLPSLSLSRSGGTVLAVQRSANNGPLAVFFRDTTLVGSISVTTTSTAYNTTSDYRLKENLAPIEDALTRVAAIPVYRFNFKTDPDKTVDGFVAHELAPHVPEAVTGEKDEVETVEIKDDDGNVTGTEEKPLYQGVDQSKLTPLLTAAIQQLLTKVEALEAEVAALKGQA